MTVLFDKKSDSAVSAPFRVVNQITVFATGLLPGDEVQFETLKYAETEPTAPSCATNCDPCLPVGSKMVIGAVRLRCCGSGCSSPQAEYPVRLTYETPYVVIDAPQNVDLRAVYIGANLGDFDMWYENTNTEGVTDAMRGCCNPPKVDVAVEKSTANLDPRVGQSTSYTLVVSNAGPFAANNTVVKDAIPEAMNVTGISVVYANGAGGAVSLTKAQLAAGYTIPVLPAGGLATITVAGSFTEVGAELNRAEVYAPQGTVDTNPANNESEVLVNVKENVSDVSIAKAVSNPAPRVGEAVSFTVTAHNSGPQDANGAVIADVLPVGFTATTIGISYTGGAAGPATATAGQLASGVSIPTMPAGADVIITVTGSFSAVGSFLNSATIKPPAGRVDSDALNNEAAVSVRVVANEVDVFVTKSLSPTAPTVGQPCTYTLAAGNGGPQDANGAILVDVLPTEFSATSLTVAYTGGASGPTTVTAVELASGFVIPVLPSGGTATVSITGSFSAAGSYTNQAVITAPLGRVETNATNNAALVVTTVALPGADLSVDKVSSPAAPSVGDTITWTVTATNAGPADAPGSTLTDSPPAGLTFSAVSYSYTGGATGPTTSTMAVLVAGVVVSLPVGGTVVATYTAVVPAGAEGRVLLNSAAITPPATVTDPSSINNTVLNTVAVPQPCALKCDDELMRFSSGASGAGVCIAWGGVTYNPFRGRAVFRMRDAVWEEGGGTSAGNPGAYLTISVTNPYPEPAMLRVDGFTANNGFSGANGASNVRVGFVTKIGETLGINMPNAFDLYADPSEIRDILDMSVSTAAGGGESGENYGEVTGYGHYKRLLQPGETATIYMQSWVILSQQYPFLGSVVHAHMNAAWELHRNAVQV